MITKDQATTERMFHFTKPDGKCAVWRRNGATITWKRPHNPDWSIPVKYGMYDYRRLESNDDDIAKFHAASECPNDQR